MAQFQLSPGVYDSEIDLTTTVPAVSTSTGAFAGVFRWGPVEQPVLIDSENTLVTRFGKPSNYNPETFFTAANFLSYSNKLYVTRAANTSGNSSSITFSTVSAVASMNNDSISNTVILNSTVKNVDDYQGKTFDPAIFFVAKYPGSLGNSLKVSVCDSANAYASTITIAANSSIDDTTSKIEFNTGSPTALVTVVPSLTGNSTIAMSAANLVASSITVGDLIKVGNNSIGTQYLKVKAIGTPSQVGNNATFAVSLSSAYNLAETYSSPTISRVWEFFGSVNRAPGTSYSQSQTLTPNTKDELHVVITDERGQFTGVPGAVLEVFEALSRATDAKNESGRSLFYKNVLANSSNYIWAGSDLIGATTGPAISITGSSNQKPTSLLLSRGQNGYDENDIPLSTVVKAYDFYASPETYDISIVLQGKAKGGANGTALANYLVANIAESRRDCVVTISPEPEDVINALGNEVDNITQFRNSLTSSSYGILDSGYKYQYDKYNDVYRYLPLNGDIGGIIARTDATNDAWWSPAGFNRGRVKNVVKLAFNPNQAQRDILWKNDVNNVVSLPGQGPVLLGDKTILGRESAFSFINIRRLFIVLRKSITIAARDLLFEFNDEFTRAQFINMVDPYLRSVEGRRGITSYFVKCDTDNNPPNIVDIGGFVGDIYVTPNRSIRNIQLNFVATRTGVEFEEIVTNW